MAGTEERSGAGLRRHLRGASVGILARLRRDVRLAGTEEWLAGLPPARRAAALWLPPALLLVLALIAAQFGWPGLLAYFLGVIALAR